MARRSALSLPVSLLVPLALSLTAAAQAPAAAAQGPGSPAEGEAERAPEADSDEVPGERVPASAIGPGRFVNLTELSRQQARAREEDLRVRRQRNGAPGEWVVPGLELARSAHSGERYVMNQWGDTRMGIDFVGEVDLSGAWIAAQTDLAVSTDGLRVIGMRDGVEVARTGWFESIGEEPSWFAIDLAGIDRAVFEARSVVEGAGWFALDDLTFVRDGSEVVLDFESLDFKQKLTRSGYGGLVWELGGGDFTPRVRSMPPPRGSKAPGGALEEDLGGSSSQAVLGGAGTPPAQVRNFQGTRMFDIAAGTIPPDTCGAVGIDHFVLVTNSNISVYEKATGTRVVNAGLAGFFNIGGSGDPRVVFDPNSRRWFVISTNFNTRIYVAASMTSDPTGMWFASFFIASSGTDSNAWPDYPTLGVNAEGLFIGAAMFSSTVRMTMFAIDKAPLIAATPTLGTITAFRGFAFDGALQPCVTYGAGEQYFISRRDGTNLRLRRINGPMTAPTFTGLGAIPIPSHGTPPDAPALGSSTPLDSVGSRLMNAVYRGGSVWTTHAIGLAGRAAVRWYEVDPVALSVVQTGTVNDPDRWFIMPSIAVNGQGDALVGFTGSNSNEWAAAYVAGRRASDPPGQMSPPQLMRIGLGPYTRLDGSGRNRWGDYSLTSVDPTDDLTLWTVQEYARPNNRWGTWVAAYQFVDCGQVSNYCTTSPNSATSGALMDSTGTLSIAANDFTLEVNDAPANKPGLFYYGPNAANGSTFGDGVRCVQTGGSSRLNPYAFTDATGSASRLLDFTSPPASAGTGAILAGSTWHFQYWYRDPAGPGGTGFNLSDGLRATFCP